MLNECWIKYLLSFQNTNFKVLWLNPAEHSLKWMSRGHLNITVLLRTDDQSVQLTGRITIKRTCNCEYIEFLMNKNDRVD